jgi:hypothetical protein
MPRTVVTKVPLDACGNPVPAAATAAPVTAATYESVPAPAASAARPALPPSAATTPAESGPLKTFSDKPAEAPAAAEGWKAAAVHPEPAAQPEAYRAQKPVENPTSALRSIEPIPGPAAASSPSAVAPVEQAPTIAPPGPAVEPAAPAHDLRDVPAAKTSGTGFLRPIPADHTT